jgi:FkbM family methyltransferase
MATRLRHWLQEELRAVGLHIERIRDPFFDQRALLGGLDAAVIFDCGGNVGQTVSNYRKLFPTAKIYSFEPSATLHAQLAQNTSTLGNVKPVRMAVADEPGESQFFEYNITGYNSMFRCTVAGVELLSECRVPVTTIDLFCVENKIDTVDILKLDIQGAELKALRGAQMMLGKQQISLIFTEVLFGPQYDFQAYYHEVAMWLAQFGYQLFRFYDLRYAPDRSLAYSDAIFCVGSIYQSSQLRGAR